MTAFWINDRKFQASSVKQTLLEFLRNQLQLTGTKDGCNGAGHCGTCTILADGAAILACKTPLAQLDGKHILTIEGLADPQSGELDPVQQAFLEHHAVQCGFCTPGMILASKALLDRNPNPSLNDIKHALACNLCRCTGYQKIFSAIQSIAGHGAVAFENAAASNRGAIGSSVRNKGDEAKVRGEAQYSADIFRKEMLIGKAVWSNYPHAELVSIVTSAAEALPGVVAVLTAKDVPGVNLHGPIIRDQPALAEGKVRFIGEPVAVVLAETEAQAEAGVRAVHVEYKPLSAVFSPLDAMEADAPQIHASRPGNILTHQPVRIGDAERALAESDYVVEGTWYVPFIEHAYLEPEAAVAEPNATGGITLWCGIQNQFQTLRQIAEVLALPIEQINMINLPMGGAFGGKCDITVQAIVCLGALVTGRPVKMVLTRAESLRVHPKRHAWVVHYRKGANRDGKLTAVQARIVGDTGAYASWGTITAETLATFVCGPYVVPNAAIDLYAIHTNNITAGAMRGFGAPEITVAIEAQMDQLAKRCGLDPFTFRRINGVQAGRALYIGQLLVNSVGYQKTLDEAQRAVARCLPECEEIGRATGRKIGVGVASGFKSVGFSANWPDPASAELELLADGRIRLCTGCADFGQGSLTTVVQIAAETLGLPIERIDLKPFESKTSPDGGPSYASRSTYVQGNTSKLAAEKFRNYLREVAGETFGLSPEDVLIQGDTLVDAQRETPLGTFAELAQRASQIRQRVAVRYDHHQHSPVPTTEAARTGYFGKKVAEDFMYGTYAFATQVAIVAVDERTGRVQVLKMIAAHDVGRAIHPHNIEGQLEGACAQGLGTALWENFRVRNGWNITNSLRRTLIPDTLRIPEIIPIIVEEDEPSGPFGAKGISEIAAIPSAAAVVNAIANAIGCEFYEIPITRGRVLKALRSAGQTHTQ
ncbi:MAG TPA: molybdopterin cofactor-binding domain-containing protein [Anaerolineae bacterium]|nr:molybdopterin cofactor-binding domain-containing protein [Anaerolineae bacterium]